MRKISLLNELCFDERNILIKILYISINILMIESNWIDGSKIGYNYP